MPPKKKKEPKPKKVPPVVLDDIDTSELTLKKLQTYTTQIHEEIIKQKNQAKFFQIEKDKLRSYWEISRQQLKDLRCQIRSRDKEIDEALESRRKDITKSQQKLKHILHENHEHMTESKYFTFLRLMENRKNVDSQMEEIFQDIADLKAKIIEEDLNHKTQVRSLQMKIAEEESQVREGSISHLGQLEAKFDKQFNKVIQRLQAEHSCELDELENSKEKQINDLIANNKKFIDQVKHYYNNLIEHNMSVIERMKESNEMLKNKLAATEKHLREANSEHTNLTIPIMEGREEIQDLHEELEYYERDRQLLSNCTKRLNKLTTHLDNLEWEHEAASLIMQRQQQEEKESQQRLLVKSLELQMQSTNQTVLLERIFKRLLSAVECIYCTIEAHGDLVTKEITDELEKTFGFRKDVKEDLEYEIVIVSKAFHDVLNTYNNKMKEHALHLDDLGFIQLTVNDIEHVE